MVISNARIGEVHDVISMTSGSVGGRSRKNRTPQGTSALAIGVENLVAKSKRIHSRYAVINSGTSVISPENMLERTCVNSRLCFTTTGVVAAAGTGMIGGSVICSTSGPGCAGRL